MNLQHILATLPKMMPTIAALLSKGSRVELLIEQGKITVVEIKRKMHMKG